MGRPKKRKLDHIDSVHVDSVLRVVKASSGMDSIAAQPDEAPVNAYGPPTFTTYNAFGASMMPELEPQPWPTKPLGTGIPYFAPELSTK